MDPWTFEYNSFVFSATNGTCVTQITGFDLPDVRTADQDIPGMHGSFAGLDRLSARTFDVDLDVIKPTTLALNTTLHNLSKATGIRDDLIPFRFKLDESLPTMRIECRPRKRNIPITRRHAFANVPVNLQFWAADPLIYSDDVEIDTTNAASESGGRGFDWNFDWNYSGGSGEAGEIQANNVGTAPGYWIGTVNGPCENPTIGGQDGFLRWIGTLNSGETLVFNAHPGQRTVLLGGTSTRFENLTLDSTWFALRTGINPIRFSTEQGNGSLTLRWRSSWWSAT